MKLLRKICHMLSYLLYLYAVILYHSVIHSKCPPQNGYVRACIKSNVFFLLLDTKMEFICHVVVPISILW